MVLGRIWCWGRRIVRLDVLASLGSLFRALVADNRVDEEADKGETRKCELSEVDAARYQKGKAYKTKIPKPIPTALAPLPTATKSMSSTMAQKVVWKQFIVRKVPGLSASRRKRTMARMSIKRTITMNSMKTMTDLYTVSRLDTLPSSL